MLLMSDEERRRCLEQGIPWGNAYLLISDHEVLLYRPPVSGGTRRLLLVIMTLFLIADISVITAICFALVAPSESNDLALLSIAALSFTGLIVSMLGMLKNRAELQLTSSTYEYALVSGFFAHKKSISGPLNEIAGIRLEHAEYTVAVILETPQTLCMTAGVYVDEATEQLRSWLETNQTRN